MTTFVRSSSNDGVLIGFFALIAGVVAIRATSPVVTVISAALAIGLVGFGVWLFRRPKRELRISPTEIVLSAKSGTKARIGHVEAGGTVAVLRRNIKGQLWFSLVAPNLPESPEIPLDGFQVPHETLAATCHEHGWAFVP